MDEKPQKPFLILAHPGHELHLFHWMEIHQPHVFLLTDGSGGMGVQRTHFSSATISSAGASPGSIFGNCSDKTYYSALLSGDKTPFLDLLNHLSTLAFELRPPLIVSDAVDGYNPMHDMCAAIGEALHLRLQAAGMAARHLTSLAVDVKNASSPAEEFRLDEAAIRRKRAAVNAYTPLAEEASKLLLSNPSAIEVETLRIHNHDWRAPWTPLWENIGKQRVADGRYPETITYARHVRPVIFALGLGTAANDPP